MKAESAVISGLSGLYEQPRSGRAAGWTVVAVRAFNGTWRVTQRVRRDRDGTER